MNLLDLEAKVGENKVSDQGAAETAPDPDHSVIGGDVVAMTKRTTSPAFQFYPKDFLSSSKVQRMSLTERGVYICLLAHCWLDGSLPDDVSELARLIGMKPSQFARVWASSPLVECFQIRNGRLTNGRLERERLKQADYRRRVSDGGKQSAAKRAEAASKLAASTLQAPTNIAVSDLRSPISDLHTAVEAPTARPQPIVQRRRADAAFEYGRLYVPNRVHQDFAMLRHGQSAELFAWYEAVCEDWTNGAHTTDSPGADMIRFWKARYDEQWPAAPVAAAVRDNRPQWAKDADARKRARAANAS